MYIQLPYNHAKTHTHLKLFYRFWPFIKWVQDYRLLYAGIRLHCNPQKYSKQTKGCSGRDCKVVIYSMSVYHHRVTRKDELFKTKMLFTQKQL
jgi:hypothetical protein